MGATPHDTPNASKKLRALADIDTVVIHYTGSMSLEGTLSWFESPDSKVSAHAVIGRGGELHTFGHYSHRLWHAGKSQWGDRVGLNSTSIGIELVGTHESGFTDEQYVSLLVEMTRIYSFCDIRFVLGHEQISPGRKIDPGPNFNWGMLRSHAERNSVPYVERVGPYNVQPPTAGPIPLVASEGVMESGEDIKEKTLWNSIRSVVGWVNWKKFS